MNDHNGGEGILRGLVQHVPLTCRQVIMEVNLYVGEHVPFQLLLRRPWQCEIMLMCQSINVMRAHIFYSRIPPILKDDTR
jgi:hypothetical protein